MSGSSDSVYAGFPTAHDVGYPSAITPSSQHQQVSGPSRPASLLNSPSTAETNSPPVPMNSTERLQPSSLSTASESQLQVVTAVAIVAIQVQLLTSSSNNTACAFFSIGIILELLGILFVICFVQMRNADDGHHSQPLSTLIRLALQVPTVLVLAGVVGLGTGLVVETIETSLSTAITMSSILVFGVILCLLTLVLDFRRVDDRSD